MGLRVYDLGNGQWDIPELRDLLENILPRNKVFNGFEVRHEFEGLGHRTMLLNARQIDHLQLILLAIEDITERKQVAEALRKSQEQCRLALDAGQVGVWRHDLTTDRVHLDALACAHYGLDTDDVPISEMLARIHPDDHAHLRQAIAVTLDPTQDEGRHAIEYRVIHPGGTIRWLSVRARVYFEEKGSLRHPVLRVGTSRDITESKITGEALRESEEMLRLFIGHAPVSLAMFDREMRYLGASRRWLKDYNLGERELKGVSHYEVFPEISEEWKAVHRRALAGEVVRADHDRFDRADGSVQWLRWEVRPWHDASGQIGGVVIFTEDITARKLDEEALCKARDDLELRVDERTAELSLSNRALRDYAAKLERLNKELQDFTWIAAHDLQEPLRKVQTLGSRLRYHCETSLSETGQDYLERMINSANQMQNLILALLSYSKLTSRPAMFKRLDLRNLLGQVVADLEDRIEETEGTVEIGELPEIEADATQMQQLFQNLIVNALKYRREVPPVVKVYGSQTSDDLCKIYVEDNGIGFEEHYLDKIFRPFQRLHDQKSQYEGTGIGLAICRKVVDSHGGTITARSTPGKGSTFIITLPVKQPFSKTPS